MTHPNEALVRRMYEAFMRGDLATVEETLHPEIVWHEPGRHPFARDYVGLEEVLQLLRAQHEVTGGTLQMTIHDVLANDEHGVAMIEAAMEHAGQRHAMKEIQVLHFREGKISEYFNHPTDQYAHDEFISKLAQ